VHVESHELEAALRNLPERGFHGANLTIPHKAAAFGMIDEVDESARELGVVNTILVDDGRLRGFNTDGPGLVRAIRDQFSVDIKDLRILLFGAGGGAGRAIAIQCAMENCERLVLVNRTFEKAVALRDELAPRFHSDRLEGPVDRLEAIPHEIDALRRQLDYVDLIINASSLGMKRSDPPILPASLLTPNLMVFDTVYASGDSRLLEDARSAGARGANGLSMLLHQGALSLEIWLNRTAPISVMRRALEAVAKN
ncbi:MAG: shikimate dehydrogenase family protein, partial [Chthoniobacterales bacterium]